MDTSAQLIATFSQAFDHMVNIYLHDMDVLHAGSTYYTFWFIIYLPFFIFKWVISFLPLILVGGAINALRFRSRKNA